MPAPLCLSCPRQPGLYCLVALPEEALLCPRRAGMVAYGSTPDGRSARAGGWGGHFLDGGSGYDIGQRALAAVARALDRRGPQTALVDTVCAKGGLEADAKDRTRGLLRWAYDDGGGKVDWARTAALAECVTASAAAGDAVANSILDVAAGELFLALETVCRQLKLETKAGCPSYKVVLAGGLMLPGSLLSERMKQLCSQRMPAALVTFAADAAQGAAMHGVLELERRNAS